MKRPRFAITIMAAVHLLLFGLLLLSWKPLEGSLWIIFSCMAVFSSQGYLLGLWAALGGRPTLWRATLIVIVAGICGWFTHRYQNGDYSLAIGFATYILTGQTFLVMGVLLLARFMGLGLNKTEDRTGHLQFSIGQVLSWTTALAVFMGATHYLKDFFATYFSKREICMSASFLAVGLAAMWLMCGNRWIAVRCFMLLLLIGLGTAWIVRGERMPLRWEAAILLGCEAGVTAASLVVVRLAGYRLTWHWPFRRPKPC